MVFDMDQEYQLEQLWCVCVCVGIVNVDVSAWCFCLRLRVSGRVFVSALTCVCEGERKGEQHVCTCVSKVLCGLVGVNGRDL